MNHHRIDSRFSQPDRKQDQKCRDARLRAAWLKVPSAFKAAPQPKGAWYSASRDTCPTSPWESVQHPVREALRAAAKTGSPFIISQVTKDVEAFYKVLLLDALAVLPDSGAAGILYLSQRLTVESGESSVALQNVIAQGSNPALPVIENAIKETAEAGTAVEKCLSLLNGLLHRNQRPNLSVAR